jgi:predicted TPR repeat methyltransferase
LHAYGPLCTLFYDADKPVAPDSEVGWYAENLPKDAGPLLELMCGSGRLLVPLVEDGFKLHGVDFSAAMLASCEAR